MLVVVNTSPFIALEKIGHLNLLRDLFGSVVRTESVAAELAAGKAARGLSRELSDAGWITTEPDPPESVLRKELGAGETSAIALALKRGAVLIVLDDLPARLVAAELGLQVTGTLGILLAAHRTGLLPDLGQAVRDLVNAGFRISPELQKSLGT